MWCGLLRLAKRWSPHIGRWWGFLQGLLYQRWRLLQEIKGHKSERLRILLYLQTTKGTWLWSALLWHRLNVISKSFCTVKGFTNRFIGTHMYINDNRELALRISHDPVLWQMLNSEQFPHKSTIGPRSLVFHMRGLLKIVAEGSE